MSAQNHEGWRGYYRRRASLSSLAFYLGDWPSHVDGSPGMGLRLHEGSSLLSIPPDCNTSIGPFLSMGMVFTVVLTSKGPAEHLEISVLASFLPRSCHGRRNARVPASTDDADMSLRSSCCLSFYPPPFFLCCRGIPDHLW